MLCSGWPTTAEPNKFFIPPESLPLAGLPTGPFADSAFDFLLLLLDTESLVM